MNVPPGTRFSEVASRVNTAAINLPSHCPVCSVVLQVEDAFLVCPSPRCSAKVKGNIRKFVVALDIKNVGDETISSLVGLGFVRCPADLYRVTSEQFNRIPRKGDAHFEKMQAGLNARRKLSVERFFGALNIPNAAEGTFLNLVQAGFNTYEKIMSITVSQAMSAMRVGDQAAKSIVKYLQENKLDIECLRACLTIESRAGKPLEGKSFIATGTLTRSRNDIYADIETAGGIVAKSVSRGVNFLIMADPTSASSKAQKARELGIRMISEQDLFQMLKGS